METREWGDAVMEVLKRRVEMVESERDSYTLWVGARELVFSSVLVVADRNFWTHIDQRLRFNLCFCVSRIQYNHKFSLKKHVLIITSTE